MRIQKVSSLPKFGLRRAQVAAVPGPPPTLDGFPLVVRVILGKVTTESERVNAKAHAVGATEADWEEIRRILAELDTLDECHVCRCQQAVQRKSSLKGYSALTREAILHRRIS